MHSILVFLGLLCGTVQHVGPYLSTRSRSCMTCAEPRAGSGMFRLVGGLHTSHTTYSQSSFLRVPSVLSPPSMFCFAVSANPWRAIRAFHEMKVEIKSSGRRSGETRRLTDQAHGFPSPCPRFVFCFPRRETAGLREDDPASDYPGPLPTRHVKLVHKASD